LLSSQSWSPSHRGRAQSQTFASMPSSPASTSPGGLLNGGVADEEIDPETPLPTFEVPQVMLAVDLALRPGESRSCTYSMAVHLLLRSSCYFPDTYTLPLPDNLPPTFKGRSFKFSYQFVVGTCRAGSSAIMPGNGMGPTGANSVSRVMNVPIRVYNNVLGKSQM
jgi:hypothetical protein